MKTNKEKVVEILNSGTEQFPFYQIMIDGEEYCATNSMEKAENLKRLLYSSGEEVGDDSIGQIVQRIAYSRLAEDQADDFIEKVWLLKEWLEKLTRPVVTEEEIQSYIAECEKTYGRPASLAIEIGICWIMDKLNTKS